MQLIKLHPIEKKKKRADNPEKIIAREGVGFIERVARARRLDPSSNLEGLALLRYHGRDRAEAHDLAEEDPGDRGQGREGDAAPAEVHAPGGGDATRLEDATVDRAADDAVLRRVLEAQPVGVAVLRALRVDYRQGEEGESRCG